MASHSASTVRAAALRSSRLSLEEAIAIGLRSGLYAGRYSTAPPAASIRWRAASRRWQLRLSITATSPARSTFFDRQPQAAPGAPDRGGVAGQAAALLVFRGAEVRLGPGQRGEPVAVGRAGAEAGLGAGSGLARCDRAGGSAALLEAAGPGGA